MNDDDLEACEEAIVLLESGQLPMREAAEVFALTKATLLGWAGNADNHKAGPAGVAAARRVHDLIVRAESTLAAWFHLVPPGTLRGALERARTGHGPVTPH